MYLIILDWSDNSVEVIRDVPDYLEGDDDALFEFVVNKLGRFIDELQYMLVSEESALVYSTYHEDGTVTEDGIDDFGQHF